ncbi:MAG: septation regulator SpoVG [Eubacteriales bacterium]|uniref:septation regulator SpoVG n=1 Tax=Fenollaria sp. TaxID=1965292 RepID=UPI002A74D863|nr:septation regulator SpoVG [Fenollaria sp.]MDD7339751.1 septation regulator SpoVG [Eubacteriales bacterium]MDY3106353.1 septation regulator SpoVG [Fenollaria sp.]
MTITDVRVRLVDKEGLNLKATASVTFDNAFVVHDIKVIEGREGLFIAMPSRKVPNGTYRDVAHPINSEARADIEEKVYKAYEAAVEDAKNEADEEILVMEDN